MTRESASGWLRSTLGPLLGAAVAVATLGIVPRCNDIQTRAEAKEAHAKSETARAAIVVAHEKDVEKLEAADKDLREKLDQKLDKILDALNNRK